MNYWWLITTQFWRVQMSSISLHAAVCSFTMHLLLLSLSSAAATLRVFYGMRLFFFACVWIRPPNILTLLTAVSHVAELVYDVSVEPGGDEHPDQERFETGSECREAVKQKGEKKGVKALLGICHLPTKCFGRALKYWIFQKQKISAS